MIIQGSDEWHQLRLGNVTASRIADVMAKTKSGYGAGRANYMAQLVIERITGAKVDSYTNAAMEWGIETEPFAREAYEMQTGEIVELAEYTPHPDIERSGASPDGLVGDKGLLEIKCPQTATHIKTLLGAKIDKKYMLQMQWQMECTGRDWCDFVSYDPRLGEGLMYHCERVNRDDSLISEVKLEVDKFLIDLTAQVAQLMELMELKDKK